MIKFDLALYFLCCNMLLACSHRGSVAEIAQRPATENKAAAQEVAGSIKSVDFKQIAYPRYRDVDGNRTTTEPGECWPAFVEYGDVTADGKEEAIVVLAEQTKGTAIPHHIYIYSLFRKESQSF